jgi:hypothetical protein
VIEEGFLNPFGMTVASCFEWRQTQRTENLTLEGVSYGCGYEDPLLLRRKSAVGEGCAR